MFTNLQGSRMHRADARYTAYHALLEALDWLEWEAGQRHRNRKSWRSRDVEPPTEIP